MIEVLAIDSRVTTALAVAIGLAILGGLLVATAIGEIRGRRTAKVPVAFRPGASDEELERRVIERYLLWGALSTLLMAIWLPAYWLREPTRLEDNRIKFQARAVTEGEHIYEEFCATCHGAEGIGGARPVTIGGGETQMAEPPLKYIYSRYKAAGRNEEDITQLIYDAINRGRPGTPMPTWALAFGGPLNSAQVDNVVAYLKTIQDVFPMPAAGRTGKQIFDANCAVCHGVNGSGIDANGNRSVGPNLQVALERLSIDELRTTLIQGRVNTNRYSMPAWGGLGKDAIDALVRFIQSIQRS